MYLLNTNIEIDAPPQRVWEIVTDYSRYSEWNPLSTAVEGRLELGASLAITIIPASRKPMRTRCRIIGLELGRRLAWKGGAPIPGLVSGEHVLEIEALPDGRTRFHNSELMRGILIPLIRGLYERSFRPQFLAMNEALKKRAEGR